MTAAFRDAIPILHHEDAYAGMPRSSDWLLLTAVYQTVLGPVPNSHVYEVESWLVANSSIVVQKRFYEYRSVQDNGLGHSFPYGVAAGNVRDTTRLPFDRTIAAQEEHYIVPPLYLIEGDILQILCTNDTAQQASIVSYWDRWQ